MNPVREEITFRIILSSPSYDKGPLSGESVYQKLEGKGEGDGGTVEKKKRE